MIKTVNVMLMCYFNDNSPISAKTLQRKCEEGVVAEALDNGFIRECGKDDDGQPRYVITEAGRKKRNG